MVDRERQNEVSASERRHRDGNGGDRIPVPEGRAPGVREDGK
ncbi:hypothetical protein MBEHAL_2616 [Halarchaeum acidiphilum MH1-52-1]|uniref:Uncharacterized protein n=1 Tax=Halarchaeum acidiphilum MH1-52-1 TaxID=1261545 RepID=U2YHC2_9EURY|nr:hypothetical protein MBEHAL_2616 [Halarchaeum acidiphilum MH1-52-1]